MDSGILYGKVAGVAKRSLVVLVSGLASIGYSSISAAEFDDDVYGRWEGPYDWPVVAIHTALLPNGLVLTYDSVGDDAAETYPQNVTQTRAMLWDPISNAVTSNSNLALGYNIFCSGLGLLSNGHLFIAGGNENTAEEKLLGIPNLTDYDPFSSRPFAERFAPEGQMQESRWYPSITSLANGEMLITGGVKGASTPEVREANGRVRALTDARTEWGADRVYAWWKIAPSGQVAMLGPHPYMHLLNTQDTGKWVQADYPRDDIYRDYGSHVMYDVGKVLVTGGSWPATRSAMLVNLNDMSSTKAADMNYPRRHHNLTVLPDGTVLASGGFYGSSQNFDYRRAVYRVERWDPATNLWHREAAMRRHRGYHSTALLLPDGRVLVAGGGICGECQGNYLEKNAEIFSPPYLFRNGRNHGRGQLADRPFVYSVPSEIAPGQIYSLKVQWSGSLKSIALIRLGAVTHGTDMEQRYIPLQFSQKVGDEVKIIAPGNNNIAPPGYYMLFVNPYSGAPSIARFVKVTGGQRISYQP